MLKFVGGSQALKHFAARFSTKRIWATRTVFEHLRAEPLLCDFTLIGGTALALQINHPPQ